MNPQPDALVGNVLALIVIAVAVLCFLDGWHRPHLYKPKKISNWDLFKLGELFDEEDDHYYNPSPTNIMRAIDESKKPSARPAARKPVRRPAPAPKHPLTDDAVDVLCSLGHKKRESKRFVPEFLEKHNPSTLEEFLKLFYSTRKK